MADRNAALQSCRLSVNLNKVALLRNTRTSAVPSVVRFAEIALAAGASGITVHPRPDRRHIRPQDVRELAVLLRGWPGRELNVEGRPSDDFLALVHEVCPHQCTLVPDAPDAPTSDKGWNFPAEENLLTEVARSLSAAGMRVVLFSDPSPTGLAAAAETAASGIEIYTGDYASAFRAERHAVDLEAVVRTAQAARRLGLAVHGGHDLNASNLRPLLQACHLDEVSIGHELTAEALEEGFEATVRRYVRLVKEALPGQVAQA